MKLEVLVDMLLKVKALYPSLSNLEVLQLMQLKTMMEANVRHG